MFSYINTHSIVPFIAGFAVFEGRDSGNVIIQ
jgi:hypothetical protein